MTKRPATQAPAAPPSVDPFAQVRPAYGDNSLADVLPGVLATLGVPVPADPLGLRELLPGVRRVVVLLVDGLGWYQLPVAAPHAPTLADLATGRLTAARALTSGFPSTTPTSLVTLGTGAPPGAHGVLAFTVRRPDTGEVLNHVAWRGDPDPADWQPVPTCLERAVAAGVATTVVSRPEFSGSGLTISAYRGAAYRGASSADVLARELIDAVTCSPAPALVYGYLPDLDHAGHHFGVDSPPWRAAAAELDRLLATLLAGLPGDAALLVTADHGQFDVPADHRFDVAADERLGAGVEVIAGEPRLRFLHTAPGATADVLAAWRQVLGDAAWVVPREEAVAEGWFGPVRAAHLPRIGDVVVACQGRYAVHSTGTEPESLTRLIGYHGSFTAVEMTIPLLVARR